ncbi:4-(cytidine 5'-diphospho)-2-C-methyl-D-erythritol kinase [Acidimicrobiia bacterium EGI L10123]|uniref:4-(cytidine 5'-diphospho)-2-C-methyl-D-erythritol kinase n=1 Tax=Salinilacustrithrix flava TaxID=2957203 RepID=UPI003D7C3548|nr:4-(cytidine 5'-diphospho)-2-C-methyl-D-erythritol kinase [Acidimicrobiia bacterium EGI L10123]
MTGPVTIVAPAKLTLTLRVTGVRDDGYHLIDAEMVSLDIADELTFRPADRTHIALTGPTAAGLSAGEDNLVAKALRAVGRTAHVTVDKRIPHGGGLGGGSADAAAVFRWAGVDDLELAARVGADVPFCTRGGRARVRGIGEVLDPLPFIEHTVTLATPDFGCDTAAVYAAWDALGGPTADGPNDLEPAALRVEPRLAGFRDALGERTGEVPVLAGSGSTWFVPGAHPGPGRVVARTVAAFES